MRPGLSAAKVKDLRVNKDAEIDNAQGLDQQRLIFWNSRVNELSLSYSSKTTIYGIVDFEWLEKTHVLQDKAKDFESKVLLKNMKRVEDIYVSEFRKAQIGNWTKGLVKPLTEESIKGLTGEIRRAQYAVERAIKTYGEGYGEGVVRWIVLSISEDVRE